MIFSQKTLYLASKSAIRKKLLSEARIPFVVISQDADEQQCDWNLSLEKTVLSIAQFKMKHAIIPDGTSNNALCFVLSADTLIEDVYGQKQGKPVNKQDARQKIIILNQGSKLATAFCLYKFSWDGKTWKKIEGIDQVVTVEYQFQIPEHWLEQYLENTAALECAGAHYIEDGGALFFKTIRGSYTGALGLPMFEVREALEKLGFFE
jgi:septum formation protein